MIRTAARKTLILAAVTLSTGALAVNCSHTKDNGPANSELGSVGLAMTLPSGATVSTVHYSLKNSSNVELRSGDIASTDPGATVSVVLGGIPAGTGYVVTLSATASDSTSCMGTSLPFSVVANMSTNVNVLLLCRGVVGNGTVIVNGTVDNCPTVNSFTVSPLAVAPGGTIAVNAMGADIDSTDTVTYLWTASATTPGTFASPTSAMTTFTCPATGSSQQTLTIRVSDNVIPGSSPAAPKCSTTATITVSCGSCGNGTIDSGEACDPAASPTGAPANFACNSSCQVVAVCGNSVVQAGEQCDPPNGTTCDMNCQSIPIVCGNNIKQPGEDCDPPNGTTCSSTCHTIVAGSGGTTASGGTTGAGGQGGSTASGGATGSGGTTASGGTTGTAGAGGMAAGGTTGTAGMTGSGGVTAACRACEAANCDPSFQGCSMFSGADKTACQAVENCIRTNHCDVNGNSQKCYCGTRSDAACLGGTGNGTCKALMEAADAAHLVGVTDPADIAGVIAGDLVDGSTPLGGAVNLIACDSFSCAAANQCGPAGPTGQF